MRKSRGPKVVWLPPDIVVNNENTALQEQGVTFFDVIGGSARDGSAGAGVAEVPLVVDSTPDEATATLSDIVNSGYRLRRIVGKIFVTMPTQNPEGAFERMVCTAGIIVRRTGQDGINSLAGAEPGTNISIQPAAETNWTDPWIWRRSWLLTNNANDLIVGECNTNYAHGPAAVDGPHVDQKTARIIGSEERLFLDVQLFSLIDHATKTNLIHVITDIRVLGTVRTNSGNRRNASR